MGATSPYWLPVLVAAMAAAAMLGVARMTAVRERAARRSDHESQRLADLLETALDLREAIWAVTAVVDPPASDLETYERMAALFLARTETVRSAHVRSIAHAWGAAATALPGNEIPDERGRWHALLVALGAARRACA